MLRRATGVEPENAKLVVRKLSPIGWAFVSFLVAILLAFLLIGLLGSD